MKTTCALRNGICKCRHLLRLLYVHCTVSLTCTCLGAEIRSKLYTTAEQQERTLEQIHPITILQLNDCREYKQTH